MTIKKKIAFAFTCLLIAGSTYSQDADIKKVIASESESFSKKDLTSWQSNWLQDATTSRAYISGQGYFATTSWDSIKVRTTRNFTKNPVPDTVDIATDSFSVRKEGNLAIVDFKQTLTYHAMAPFHQFVSWEHRVLVKKSGQWKIANLVSTDLTIFGPTGTELMMNAVGYTFLLNGNTERAIEILALNTKLYPNSFNVYDSLGEAYAAAGQKDQAIQNYKKSLELNPGNEGGKKALESLTK